VIISGVASVNGMSIGRAVLNIAVRARAAQLQEYVPCGTAHRHEFEMHPYRWKRPPIGKRARRASFYAKQKRDRNNQ
jgi:hypothetical protein